MKVPTNESIFSYIRAIGLIIAGMIMGSALFMSLYQHNFSILYEDNQRLVIENTELSKELEPFIRKQNNTIIVRQLRIHIQPQKDDDSLEETVTTELRQALQSDLELLRGVPINSVSETLIVAKGIIERKIYRLTGNQEYTIEIPMIIVKNSELTLWAKALPYIKTD